MYDPVDLLVERRRRAQHDRAGDVRAIAGLQRAKVHVRLDSSYIPPMLNANNNPLLYSMPSEPPYHLCFYCIFMFLI